MRNLRNHIVFLVLAALMLGCTDKGTLPEEGKGRKKAEEPDFVMASKALCGITLIF